jgi:tetratricopeptide (TPR) repeat protein
MLRLEETMRLRILLAAAIILAAIPAVSAAGRDDWAVCGELSGARDLEVAIIAACTRVIDAKPEMPKLAMAHFWRGLSLSRKALLSGGQFPSWARYDQAIADFSEAIRLDPKNGDAYRYRGAAYSSQMKYSQAIADFGEAIRLDPKDVNAYDDRGEVYQRLAQYDQAIADYSTAIRIDQEHSLIYQDRGEAYESQGKHDQAIADFTKAIQIGLLSPELTALIYSDRGHAYEAIGNKDRAQADFDMAKNLTKP